MIVYVGMLNVWRHVSGKIASGVPVRGDSGVAGEGRVVGLPKFYSWDKCTMPLMNINSDWMSNASSGLCIILHYLFTQVLYFPSWDVMNVTLPLLITDLGQWECEQILWRLFLRDPPLGVVHTQDSLCWYQSLHGPHRSTQRKGMYIMCIHTVMLLRKGELMRYIVQASLHKPMQKWILLFCISVHFIWEMPPLLSTVFIAFQTIAHPLLMALRL